MLTLRAGVASDIGGPQMMMPDGSGSGEKSSEASVDQGTIRNEASSSGVGASSGADNSNSGVGFRLRRQI